jgi:hypothetical protein
LFGVSSGDCRSGFFNSGHKALYSNQLDVALTRWNGSTSLWVYEADMRLKSKVVALGCSCFLWTTACTTSPAPPRNAAGNPNTPAGKVGQAAYKVGKEAEKAAKEAERKIDKAARDAQAGYKDAKKTAGN